MAAECGQATSCQPANPLRTARGEEGAAWVRAASHLSQNGYGLKYAIFKLHIERFRGDHVGGHLSGWLAQEQPMAVQGSPGQEP